MVKTKSIRVSESLHKKLRIMAFRQGMSIGALISWLLSKGRTLKNNNK